MISFLDKRKGGTIGLKKGETKDGFLDEWSRNKWKGYSRKKEFAQFSRLSIVVIGIAFRGSLPCVALSFISFGFWLCKTTLERYR